MPSDANLSPLYRPFNVAVNQIAGRLFPTGFAVGPVAPDSFDKLKARLDGGQRMLVWSGASDRTIFACPETNYAFRAWHDWCHWKGGHDFTPAGEREAAETMKGHVRTLYGTGPEAERFCAIIDAEVNGQVDYFTEHGDFPEDQVACTRDYLAKHFNLHL